MNVFCIRFFHLCSTIAKVSDFIPPPWFVERVFEFIAMAWSLVAIKSVIENISVSIICEKRVVNKKRLSEFLGCGQHFPISPKKIKIRQ